MFNEYDQPLPWRSFAGGKLRTDNGVFLRIYSIILIRMSSSVVSRSGTYLD